MSVDLEQDKNYISKYWDGMAAKTFQGGVIAYNFNKLRRIVRYLLEYECFVGANVLEIGCGPALAMKMFITLHAGGFKYIGTDTSEAYVSQLPTHGLKGVQAFSHELPFEDKSKDIIVMLDVFEHIHPEFREKSYSEIHRVLKDGGLIFINNPLSQTAHTACDYGWSPKELAGMISAMNLNIIRIEKYEVGYTNQTRTSLYQFIVLQK